MRRFFMSFLKRPSRSLLTILEQKLFFHLRKKTRESINLLLFPLRDTSAVNDNHHIDQVRVFSYYLVQ